MIRLHYSNVHHLVEIFVIYMRNVIPVLCPEKYYGIRKYTTPGKIIYCHRTVVNNKL